MTFSTTEVALTEIRAATRTHHDRLEAKIDLIGRLTEIGAYRRQLAAMLGFYEPLEANLGAIDWSSSAIDFESRRKGALIRSDLGRLGFSSREIDALPRVREGGVPAPRDATEALGCLYVLEGATLGGTLIARHVRRVLPEEAHEALAFYDGYGTRTGAMWRSFQAALAKRCEHDTTAMGKATAAAQKTFEDLERWLTDRLS